MVAIAEPRAPSSNMVDSNGDNAGSTATPALRASPISRS
jgi:hypothetical protein